MMWLLDILLLPIVFYSLFLLTFVWLLWATEEEVIGHAFFAGIFIFTLGILKFGSFGGFIDSVKEHPFSVLVLLGLYVLFGTLWSIFKWFLFVKDKAKDLNAEIVKNGRQKAAEKYQSDSYDTPRLSAKDILDSNFSILSPKVTEHKEKITTWIMLWVPSLTWFLLNDPIRRLANWIYDRMHKAYQAIADSAFKIEQ